MCSEFWLVYLQAVSNLHTFLRHLCALVYDTDVSTQFHPIRLLDWRDLSKWPADRAQPYSNWTILLVPCTLLVLYKLSLQYLLVTGWRNGYRVSFRS